MVHSFHHGGRCILLVVAMVEEKFCQRRKQRRSGSVTGAICDPEQNSAVFHSQPAIDIAAHLDDWAITRCNLPTWQRQRFLWNQRLLLKSRSCQISLMITPPFLQFIILPLQRSPHGAEAKLGLDSGPQYRRIDRS